MLKHSGFKAWKLELFNFPSVELTAMTGFNAKTDKPVVMEDGNEALAARIGIDRHATID